VSFEKVDYQIAVPPSEDFQQNEPRMACLDECLANLTPENRSLIVEYYKADKGGQIEHRQKLANRLGLRRDALANRAQRLRDKLERCVRRCLGKNN
jgi:hypothetical protein